MHVVRNNFSPVNVARTSKKVGQPWSRPWGVARQLGLCGVPLLPHVLEGVR